MRKYNSIILPNLHSKQRKHSAVTDFLNHGKLYSYKMKNILYDLIKLFFMGYLSPQNSFKEGLARTNHIVIYLRKSYFPAKFLVWPLFLARIMEGISPKLNLVPNKKKRNVMQNKDLIIH